MLAISSGVHPSIVLPPLILISGLMNGAVVRAPLPLCLLCLAASVSQPLSLAVCLPLAVSLLLTLPLPLAVSLPLSLSLSVPLSVTLSLSVPLGVPRAGDDL